jgi:SWI/SNF-related matrix-associated actin-dependent regulator of chromatin subfamily A-like protein 1
LTVKRALIGDTMGLGKSCQAIATTIRAHYLLRDQFPGLKVIPSVVVTTATMKAQWRAELAQWWPTARVQVLSGLKDKLEKNRDVYIVNYDVLASGFVSDPDTNQPLAQVVLSPAGSALCALPKAVMVLDESHYIRSPSSQRTLAALELGRNAHYKLLLTGTAILNRPVELIPQLDFLGYLDPVFRGEQAFKWRYCAPTVRNLGRGRRVWDYSGASNLDELHAKLQDFTIRRRKADVAWQLPPKRFARITVELSNRAEYDALEAAVEAAPPEVRVGMLSRIRQACGRGKLLAAREWITAFLEADPDEKLVVFAHHREVQDVLLRAFPDAVRVLGSDSGPARAEAVRGFQRDPSVRLIICSLMAGKEGITLTAAANMLMVEFDWVPGNLEQAHDRIHRIGQAAELVTIWTLAAEDSLDGKLDELLRAKRVVTGSVLDGQANVLTEANVKMAAIADLLRRVKARHQKQVATRSSTST